MTDTPSGALDHIRHVLEPALHEGKGEMALGDLVSGMKARAFGLILLALALPCCLPFVYLLPQIVAFPMLFLCGQLLLGRTDPWLPERLANRTFKAGTLINVVDRAKGWFGWIELVARPRLLALSSGTGQRILGALLAIPSASILLPLPLTNTVPGLGVAIAAFGMVERDGLLITLGLVIGLGWVVLLLISGGAAVAFLTGLFQGG